MGLSRAPSRSISFALRVIVPSSSPVRHVGDLAGNSVCFLIAASAERAVSEALESGAKPWLRRPFSEEGEMNDAYNAQSCHAVVAWTVGTLISGERLETKWHAGGAAAMLVVIPEAGLYKEWQRRVLAAVGTYGDIFERNLGSGSPFRLERGLNANQASGGLRLSPFLD